MDSRYLSVFRSIPNSRRVFSLSPVGRKHQQLLYPSASLPSPSPCPSRPSSFSLSMTSNGFSSVLEPKCSCSYKDIRCRSESVPVVSLSSSPAASSTRYCPRSLSVSRQRGSRTVRERSSLLMHTFALQRMIISPGVEGSARHSRWKRDASPRRCAIIEKRLTPDAKHARGLPRDSASKKFDRWPGRKGRREKFNVLFTKNSLGP